jgi:hypothetical protein
MGPPQDASLPTRILLALKFRGFDALPYRPAYRATKGSRKNNFPFSHLIFRSSSVDLHSRSPRNSSLFLWLRSFRSAKSNLNLSENSVKLFFARTLNYTANLAHYRNILGLTWISRRFYLHGDQPFSSVRGAFRDSVPQIHNKIYLLIRKYCF